MRFELNKFGFERSIFTRDNRQGGIMAVNSIANFNTRFVIS
jgi:hypothetical protein